jgi:prepilin-type N-terminal cleavage/methylation domain-containing protein
VSTDRALHNEGGFTLVELMIASVVLTVGLVSMAQLLAVSTVMHSDARQATSVTHLAQSKIEELVKLNFATAPAVQIGGSLTADIANYFDSPQNGTTRRWLVQAGPAANTRLVTVRIINLRGRYYGSRQDLTTVLRRW